MADALCQCAPCFALRPEYDEPPVYARAAQSVADEWHEVRVAEAF